MAKKKAKKKTNGPISYVKRKLAAARKKKRFAEMLKGNPAHFKKLTGSTGWMKATAVKFVKRKGKPMQVLLRRAKPRRSSKR